MKKKLILIILLLIATNGFTQTVYRIRLRSSSYSAQLRGITGTPTVGISINGSYSSRYLSHEFLVSVTGNYELYVDPLGGSSYSEDTYWDDGQDGKTIYADDLVEHVHGHGSGVNGKIASPDLVVTGVSSGTYQYATVTVGTDGRLSYAASGIGTGSEYDTVAVTINASSFDSTITGEAVLMKYNKLRLNYLLFDNDGDTIFVAFPIPAYVTKFVGWEVSGISNVEDEDNYMFCMRWNGIAPGAVLNDLIATLAYIDTAIIATGTATDTYVGSNIQSLITSAQRNSVRYAELGIFMIYRTADDAAAEDFYFTGLTLYFVRQVSLNRTRAVSEE